MHDKNSSLFTPRSSETSAFIAGGEATPSNNLIKLNDFNGFLKLYNSKQKTINEFYPQEIWEFYNNYWV